MSASSRASVSSSLAAPSPASPEPPASPKPCDRLLASQALSEIERSVQNVRKWQEEEEDTGGENGGKKTLVVKRLKALYRFVMTELQKNRHVDMSCLQKFLVSELQKLGEELSDSGGFCNGGGEKFGNGGGVIQDMNSGTTKTSPTKGGHSRSNFVSRAGGAEAGADRWR